MDFQEIFDQLGFDWQLALINAVNFLVFFVILNRFVIKRIAKAVNERQDKLDQSLKNAERLEKELNEAKAKAEAIIKDANLEASDIVKKHREEAEHEASEIKSHAQEEAGKIKKKAKEVAAQEKETILKEIQGETAELSIKAAEKVLEEKLDEEKDKKIVEDFIKKLKKEGTQLM